MGHRLDLVAAASDDDAKIIHPRNGLEDDQVSECSFMDDGSLASTELSYNSSMCTDESAVSLLFATESTSDVDVSIRTSKRRPQLRPSMFVSGRRSTDKRIPTLPRHSMARSASCPARFVTGAADQHVSGWVAAANVPVILVDECADTAKGMSPLIDGDDTLSVPTRSLLTGRLEEAGSDLLVDVDLADYLDSIPEVSDDEDEDEPRFDPSVITFYDPVTAMHVPFSIPRNLLFFPIVNAMIEDGGDDLSPTFSMGRLHDVDSVNASTFDLATPIPVVASSETEVDARHHTQHAKAGVNSEPVGSMEDFMGAAASVFDEYERNRRMGQDKNLASCGRRRISALFAKMLRASRSSKRAPFNTDEVDGATPNVVVATPDLRSDGCSVHVRPSSEIVNKKNRSVLKGTLKMLRGLF